VFTNPTQPNLADFLIFLSNTVQIPSAALPNDSPWPQYALDMAIDLALLPPSSPGISYTLAVYNGATHILFAITPDQSGQVYFTNARGTGGYGLVQPSTGLVVSSSDQGTSSSLAKPQWAEGLTVGQLEMFKTPWGRTFLTWNQAYGPTIVGLT
jgi:hypothetical protein